MPKITICSSDNESRITKIRNSRSINDLIAVINDIVDDLKSSKKTLSNLMLSTSASKKYDDGEFTIDRTGKNAPRVVKVSLKPSSPSTVKIAGKKLKNFVVPSVSSMASHTKVLQDLYANAIELESIDAMIKQSFSTATNYSRTAGALKALRQEVDRLIDNALTVLNKLASKHIPSEMKALSEQLVEFVLDYVDPKTYSQTTQFLYVAPINGTIQFSFYVSLDDLKDKSGFIYSEYYIVLTGVIDKKGFITYFLNTLPDFKIPGKYDIGENITSEADMLKRIKLLFSVNDVIIEHEKLPIPANTGNLSNYKITSIPGIIKAEVIDNKIVVKTKVTREATINKIIVQLIPLFNRLAGVSHTSKSIFKYNIRKMADGSVIQFILVPTEKRDKKINSSKIKDLQKILDLDDKSIERIKLALKGMV